mgnify:CR=1 FL=1
MSTELAKRETLISNIGFFEMKLGYKTDFGVLDRYKTENLQRIHNERALEFQKSGLDTSQVPMKYVCARILETLKQLKEAEKSQHTTEWEKVFNRAIEVSQYFEIELREAGYEPAILEAFEPLNK